MLTESDTLTIPQLWLYLLARYPELREELEVVRRTEYRGLRLRKDTDRLYCTIASLNATADKDIFMDYFWWSGTANEHVWRALFYRDSRNRGRVTPAEINENAFMRVIASRVRRQ